MAREFKQDHRSLATTVTAKFVRQLHQILSTNAIKLALMTKALVAVVVVTAAVAVVFNAREAVFSWSLMPDGWCQMELCYWFATVIRVYVAEDRCQVYCQLVKLSKMWQTMIGL